MDVYRDEQIDQFINSLSSMDSLANVFNPYSDDEIYGGVRRENLKIYLQKMKSKNPKVLLVGEAPGYHGCRFSGIPFTSEWIMLNGVGNLDLFNDRSGYQKTSLEQQLKTEQTADIVWEKLSEYSNQPLLWNSFPLHPYDKFDPTKNRPPLVDELRLGKPFIQALISIFSIKYIVPIGNIANDILNKKPVLIGVELLNKVRHPARGGKMEFNRGIDRVFSLF